MITLCLILLTGLFPQDWTTFKSIEGGFQIEVPGEMVQSTQQIDTDLGLVTYHSFHCTTLSETTGNYVYMVSFYRSPAINIPEDSTALIQEFFDATVEQAAQSVSGEVVILDQIKYQNRFQGRFWRIHYNGGRSVLKTKVYLAGDTFYSIQVAVDAAFGLSEEIDHFLDSFKIIKSID